MAYISFISIQKPSGFPTTPNSSLLIKKRLLPKHYAPGALFVYYTFDDHVSAGFSDRQVISGSERKSEITAQRST